MARFNKIYAGPVTEVTPQVQELPAAAATLPGLAVIMSSGKFAIAGANTTEKVFISQDNYLVGEGVDTAVAIDDIVIGMELLDEQFFNVRVPTGVSVVKGVTKLTTNATGRFVIATTGQRIIAIPEETYNNTSGVDQLVRVRRATGHLAAA
ncbi:MAG: hypothetical protein EON87_00940 [Brevundimonas sp.]|nr:MAG: hypothetical protein EON87_00940 [Brevundimonas sp.]